VLPISADGGQNVTTLLGQQATAASVLSQIPRQHLVHFAVHGLVDRRFDDVFAASLLLAPGEGGQDRLYLQDVYRMPLGNCHLAVLSACQSNVGAARKLEAGATLTRAFLSAGAERVVSSLWQVDDEATLALMRAFADAIGSALEQGAPPNYAHALQQARRRVKQAPGKAWQDPYFWAPFVLVGPAE
jgi:CHAT domain-containing protein